MAKKYIFRSFNPGANSHKEVNPLINLSLLGISTNTSIMKTSLGLSTTLTQMGAMQDLYYPSFYDAFGLNQFAKFRDLTKNQTSNYAFYDMSYQLRRLYCQQIARDNEINFILDTITNEAIIPDENGYIAQLDLDRLKLFLNNKYSKNNTDADKLIRDCRISFSTIYSALGWDDNNGAWQYFKKFLIEGFVTLEILIDQKTKSVSGFLELDPITLQPDILITDDGKQIFVWYLFKGESRQRIIPDSNLIYVAWNSRSPSRSNNISYVESLTRSFTMLKQLEDSQLIWNILNAQKRMKITVPVGDLSPARAQQRINEIIASYTEEVSIDSASGQMLVNGEPKFNFQKTYVFEDRGGAAVGLEAVDTGAYDLGTEALQYFWRKFVLESQVPANRFLMNVAAGPSNSFIGDANVTREEYAFGRFIQRIQEMFKIILTKPLWVQLCLKHPELSKSEYLKQGLGVKYNEENIFTLAKKRTLISEGASTVSTLMGIHDMQDKPYFSIEFLIKEFLGFSDQDLEINRKYKEAEIRREIENAKSRKKSAKANGQQEGEESTNESDFGGGGFDSMTGADSFGSGADFGSDADFGADTTPEPEPTPEPEAAPEPAPESTEFGA